METTRRKLLGTVAAASAIGIGSTQVLANAQDDMPSIAITEVNVKGETVTLKNTGDSEADLSGYKLEFEFGGERNQRRDLPDGTTVGAGETLTVATGAGNAGDVEVTNPYTGGVIRDEGNDVIALLTPGGDVVARSDESAEEPTTTPEEDETTTEDSGDETTTEDDQDDGEDSGDETTTTPQDGDGDGSDETDDGNDDGEEDTGGDGDGEGESDSGTGGDDTDGTEDTDDC